MSLHSTTDHGHAIVIGGSMAGLLAARAFHYVANLLTPPSSLLHPRVAGRVFWGNVRAPGRQPLVASAVNINGRVNQGEPSALNPGAGN